MYADLSNVLHIHHLGRHCIGFLVWVFGPGYKNYPMESDDVKKSGVKMICKQDKKESTRSKSSNKWT